MVNRKTIIGATGLLAIIGASILGNFLSKPSRAFVQKPSQPFSVRVEQRTDNIYTSGTCPVPERIDPRVVPVPKPNPDVYESAQPVNTDGRNSELDTSGWRASSDNYTKLSMKVVNPNGSVHYEIEIKDKDGRVINKYCEPSNEKYVINPRNYHSTPVIISNPDGSHYLYRDCREGETLGDVLREGPVSRFVPNNQTRPVPVPTPGLYQPPQPVMPCQPLDSRVYGPSRDVSPNPYGNELPPMPIPREK